MLQRYRLNILEIHSRLAYCVAKLTGIDPKRKDTSVRNPEILSRISSKACNAQDMHAYSTKVHNEASEVATKVTCIDTYKRISILL